METVCIKHYYNIIFCFRHYIVIRAKAVSQDKLIKWAGLVESKIRILIGQLESSKGIELAHIYPRSYGPLPCQDTADVGGTGDNSEPLIMWFVGLEFEKSDGKMVKVTLTSEIQTFSTAGVMGVVLVLCGVCLWYVPCVSMVCAVCVYGMCRVCTCWCRYV